MRRGTALFLALIIIAGIVGAWASGYAEKRLPAFPGRSFKAAKVSPLKIAREKPFRF